MSMTCSLQLHMSFSLSSEAQGNLIFLNCIFQPCHATFYLLSGDWGNLHSLSSEGQGNVNFLIFLLLPLLVPLVHEQFTARADLLFTDCATFESWLPRGSKTFNKPSTRPVWTQQLKVSSGSKPGGEKLLSTLLLSFLLCQVALLPHSLDTFR